MLKISVLVENFRNLLVCDDFTYVHTTIIQVCMYVCTCMYVTTCTYCMYEFMDVCKCACTFIYIHIPYMPVCTVGVYKFSAQS